MLFRRNKNEDYVAFMSGEVIPLEEVADKVFAEKMMGDGYAIEPDDGHVVSPMDGEVTVVFPTGHAYGITHKDGIEILIHLGIDTVELNGLGFESRVKVGDKVKAGAALGYMDLAVIKEAGKPITSMHIFTSGQQIDVLKAHEQVVCGQGKIIQLKK